MPAASGADTDRIERIVLVAMSRDSGLDEEVARGFAEQAQAEVAGGVGAHDAPELARRMLGAAPEAGASAATVVAAAASEVLADGAAPPAEASPL